MARFDLTDFEWSVIQPLLPNKPRGVPRVDDRRVLNGIFWRLRTGAPWADIPGRYGPYTTCVNRFNRWRKAGVWDYLLDAVSKAYDGDIQMIDSSSIRVHRHAANGKKGHPIPLQGPLAGRFDRARFDPTDFERSVIQPLLPNKPHRAPRVDDRRVLNGIFRRLRTGGAVGGHPVAVRSSHDLREPLQPVAQGGGVGLSFGRCVKGL